MSAKRSTSPKAAKPVLRGSATLYPDGRVVTPPPLDLDKILADLAQLTERDRSAFLCVIAHDLTVDIRALLIDRPISDNDLNRIWHINEFLHQLTSSVNPRHRLSAEGDVDLVRAIIESACQYGLQAAIGRALANAAGNMMQNSPVAAK
jgi:hypothetical protein